MRNIGVINSTVFSSENLNSVSSLTIANSGATEIQPGAFRPFSQLSKLSLYQNHLTDVNTLWLSNPQLLENLTMFANNVQRIELHTLSRFCNLVALNLAKNKIKTIADGSFKGLGKLSVLDLAGNELSYASRDTFSGLESTKMKLGGNPWDCSCELKSFAIFLKDLINASLLQDPMDVTCINPPTLEGSPVWNISEFHCPSPSPPEPPKETFIHVGVPILLVFLVVLLSVLLLVTLLYKRKQEKKQVKPEEEREKDKHQAMSNTEEQSKNLQRGNMLLVKPGAGWQKCNAKGRAKSASAVLHQSHFIQDTVKPGPNKNENMNKANLKPADESVRQLAEIHKRTTGGTESPFKIKDASTDQTGRHHLEHLNKNMTVDCIGSIDQHLEGQTRTEDNQTYEDTDQMPYLSIDTRAAKETPEIIAQSHLISTNRPSLGQTIKRMSTWPLTKKEWKEEDKVEWKNKYFLRPEDASKARIHPENVVGFSVGDKPYQRRSQGEEADSKLSPKDDIDGNQETAVKKLDSATGDMYQQSTGEYGFKGSSQKRSADSQREGTIGKKRTQNSQRALNSVSVEGNAQGSGTHSLTKVERARHSGSPGDANLLQNNEYAFIDLLHEVVVNQGRWTRDRWKQTHQKRVINKP
ncbi:UNVERIFIED_CONTAM: hypothetical protein FKN15_025004 [Acipenser sinensis]